MTVFEAVLLGILQGLTEFLPVSSSGHLALAESFFGVESPGVTFEVFVHFGTALAVIVYFRRRVAAVVVAAVRWLFRREYVREDARLALHLAIGTVPAGVAGYLLKERVEILFDRPSAVSIFLIVTGFVLWATRFRAAGAKKQAESAGDSLAIGVAQAAAIVPGISRSGATVATGLMIGLPRKRAAEFAFLLSLPVILGATAASVGDLRWAGDALGTAVLAGTAAAFASALPAIAILMRVVSAGVFHRFAFYCWGVGAAALAVSLA